MNWAMLRKKMNSAWLFQMFFNSWPISPMPSHREDGLTWKKGILRVDRWRLDICLENSAAQLIDMSNWTAIQAPEAKMYTSMKSFLQKLDGNDGTLKNEIALVLAGGGAKGAYQIGVWAAIRELGLEPHITGISGSSIGALNALLFALGDWREAFQLWNRMTDPRSRMADRKRYISLKAKIDRQVDKLGQSRYLRKLTESLIVSQPELEHALLRIAGGKTEQLHQCYHIFSTATPSQSVQQQKTEYVSWNTMRVHEIVTAILASTALPIVYDPVDFRGDQYWDGGIYDNVPFKPLYDCGYRKFIVVYLDSGDKIAKKQKELADLPNCYSASVIPDPASFKTDLIATLDMSNPTHMRERVVQGYQDGLRTLTGKFINEIRKEAQP